MADEPVAGPVDDGLKRLAVAGLKWSGVSQSVRQATQLVTMVVLARLLPPSDFGIFGMAAIAIGVASLFKDLGTASAAIQRAEPSSVFLSSVFWLQVGLGATLAVALACAAPAVAAFFAEPRVTSLLRALALGIAVGGLSALPQAVMERALRFRALALIEISAGIAGAGAGIAGAVLGHGAWSLVYASLTTTAVAAASVWSCSGWRPTPRFARAELRSVAAYGGGLLGFNVVNYAARNGDNLLIGRRLGSTDLGFYDLAYRIMLLPLQNISAVASRALFPFFARVQGDDEGFRAAYVATVGSIAFVAFPLMTMLGVLARELIVAAFGEPWAPSAMLLALLAPVGAIQAVGTTVGIVYQAKGRTDLLFRWGLCANAVVIAGFVVGVHWGTVGVAVAYALTSALIAIPNLLLPCRLIGLPLSRVGRELWRPALGSLGMMGAMIAARRWWFAGADPAVAAAALAAIGIACYGAQAALIDRRRARTLIGALRGG